MSDKFKSVVKSALIAGGGAVAVYLLSAISSGQLDLGVWGPLAAAVASWLVNLAKVQAEPAKA